MCRILLVGLSLIFCPAFVFAQACGTQDLIDDLTEDERARLDALVAPHPYPEGNLWRAVKSGSTVVVAGTLHIPDPRLGAIAETLAPLVKNADILVLEATSEDEAELAQTAAAKPDLFFITDGPTLIDLLSDSEWQAASSKLEALGIPAFVGAKFQPWYMNLTLAIPSCALSLMQSGERGLDRQLETLAVEAGVPLESLDDAEAVIRVFADEPFEEQLTGLRLTLNTQDNEGANTSTLIQAFFDGRTREGWEFARILIDRAGIEDGQKLFDEVNESLLVGRNEDWEAKLPGLIEGKKAVIAVGAAHLSGESGVLRALERLGYLVEPL